MTDLDVLLFNRVIVAAASSNQSTVEPFVLVVAVSVNTPEPQRVLSARLGTVGATGVELMRALTCVLDVDTQPDAGSNAAAK